MTALDVLAEELTATETLIAGYQKKLSVLRQLHKGIKSRKTQSEVVNNIVADIIARAQSRETCGIDNQSGERNVDGGVDVTGNVNGNVNGELNRQAVVVQFSKNILGQAQ